MTLGMKYMNRIRRSARLLASLLPAICMPLLFSGCATNDALRDPLLAWDGTTVFHRPAACDHGYAYTDDLIWQEMNNKVTDVHTRSQMNRRVSDAILQDAAQGDANRDCWKTSYENHQNLPAIAGGTQAPGYDLFYAEFDDQGERTDVSHNHVPFDHSQVALIESKLESLVAKESDPQVGGGLNIVLFTHGWHGNADARNDYSIWFKAILEQITALEPKSRRAQCFKSDQRLKSGNDSAEVQRGLHEKREFYACSSDTDGKQFFKERRTVGIEIAWRGDSIDVPGLRMINFWDRKGAAQTAARGAISDLMGRLHKFYLSHSCRKDMSGPDGNQSCDAVHLLTIGHSFGALIDYHSLSDDLSTGVLADRHGRAYGFGDTTVLLNPAFEAEREITLVEASINHPPYPTAKEVKKSEQAQEAGQWPSLAQMPTLVTLQSEGDWATHYAFPVARVVTGIFENTSGSHEYSRSIEASGWVQDYYTHHLVAQTSDGKDQCTSQTQPLDWYCPFDLEHEEQVVHPLTLYKEESQKFPDFAPLWTVRVQKTIMKDHDDISNPAIVRFVALLFQATCDQEDLMNSRDAHPVPHTR
jgi:hypothetical protein